MSWWIVNYIPSWVLLIGLIMLIAGGAALIQRYVRRRFPVIKGDAHNDVTKFTYGFIGFVYAFFVVADSSSPPCGVRTTPQTATHAPKAQQRCKWLETRSFSTRRIEGPHPAGSAGL